MMRRIMRLAAETCDEIVAALDLPVMTSRQLLNSARLVIEETVATVGEPLKRLPRARAYH